MGKHDFMSPKAIANRIKAKGLTKLRWYCQLCEKACRDENGFKCHQMSDGHRRNMELFGSQPEKVVENYSEMFEEDFLEHLRTRHPYSRVSAKVVYNEFIADRNHIHMNSTKWYTLTEFVKYLGREGKCKVDETEKGWFITLIQQDPFEKLQMEKQRKRALAEQEDEERMAAAIEAQAKRARAAAGSEEPEDRPQVQELDREALGNQEIKLGLAIAPKAVKQEEKKAKPPLVASSLFADDDDAVPAASKPNKPGKTSVLDQLMEKELAATNKKAKTDHWIAKGIAVKVLAKSLGEYYNKKGVIQSVENKYVAQVEMDDGALIQIDQKDLQTVIPVPGGTVLVVNGVYRGTLGKLREVDQGKYQGQIQLSQGPHKGKEVWLEYEDFSRYYST